MALHKMVEWHALILGPGDSFATEAFNENGASKASEVAGVP